MVPLIVVNLLDLEHVGVFTNAVENFCNYIQARSASKRVWSDAFGSLTHSLARRAWFAGFRHQKKLNGVECSHDSNLEILRY